MTTTSATEHDSPIGRSRSGVGRESAGKDAFSTDIAGLPGSVANETVQLPGGAVFDLTAGGPPAQLRRIDVVNSRGAAMARSAQWYAELRQSKRRRMKARLVTRASLVGV